MVMIIRFAEATVLTALSNPFLMVSVRHCSPTIHAVMALALYQQDFRAAAGYASAFVVIFYDYGLTFAREVHTMWGAKRKYTFATILFYIVRYAGLLFVILVMRSTWSTKSHLTCIVLERVQMALNILLMAAVAVFSAMRVYALYFGNYFVFGIVLLLGLTNPILTMYISIMTEPQVAVLSPTLNSCGMMPKIAPGPFEKLFMGTRACSIVADAVVVILTWMKTLHYRRAAMRANARMSVTTVLLKDGTAFFSSLLFLNVFALGIGQIADLIVVMTTWTTVVTSILTCRFMLDLREAASSSDPSGLSRTIPLSAMPVGIAFVEASKDVGEDTYAV
ncbi:hypothetical protein BKA93DRAFT_778596 [Sparassis latifolia]